MKGVKSKMINFKKFMIFVALLILISGLSSTSILAQDSQEIPFDKLKIPTELQTIINNFERLKYNFKAFKDGEKAQELMVEFQYQGKEKVNDVEVDKLFIKTSAMGTSDISQMTFWLNDGEIVKTVQGGQEIPAAMADIMKDKMLPVVLFPFIYFKKLNLEEIASEGEVIRTAEMIGEREVDIIKIKGNNLAKHGLESGTLKLANFDKLLLIVDFEYITLEETEAEFKEGKFEVTEIELR